MVDEKKGTDLLQQHCGKYSILRQVGLRVHIRVRQGRRAAESQSKTDIEFHWLVRHFYFWRSEGSTSSSYYDYVCFYYRDLAHSIPDTNPTQLVPRRYQSFWWDGEGMIAGRKKQPERGRRFNYPEVYPSFL